MPRYSLDQAELLRLVILAVGADVGTPDEAMGILRRAEYVSEVENDPSPSTPAEEPQTLLVASPRTLIGTRPYMDPQAEAGTLSGDKPARPE